MTSPGELEMQAANPSCRSTRFELATEVRFEAMEVIRAKCKGWYKMGE